MIITILLPPVFRHSKKKKKPETFSSEYEPAVNDGVISGDDTDASGKEGKSIFQPLKQLFSGKQSKTENDESNNDPIKASPLSKAKRLPDLNLDELVKSEGDFK